MNKERAMTKLQYSQFSDLITKMIEEQGNAHYSNGVMNSMLSMIGADLSKAKQEELVRSILGMTKHCGFKNLD